MKFGAKAKAFAVLLCLMLVLIPATVQADGPTKITEANVNVAVPVAGNCPATPAPVDADLDKYYADVVYWKHGGSFMDASEQFVAGETYTLEVYFVPKSGYCFDYDTAFTVNGMLTSNITIGDGVGSIRRTSFTALASTPQVINEINITGVVLPAAGGDHPDMNVGISTANISAKTNPHLGETAYWGTYSGDYWYVNGNKFVDDTEYTLFIEYNLDAGYILGNNVTVNVDGQPWAATSISSTEICLHYDLGNPPQLIYAIDIDGVTAPVAGEEPTTAGITTDAQIELDSIKWMQNGEELAANAKFVAGEEYALRIYYSEKAGYALNSNIVLTSNLTHVARYLDLENKYIQFSYTAAAAPQIVVIGSANADVDVPIGGDNPDFSATVDANANYTAAVSAWYCHDGNSYPNLYDSDTFVAGNDYAVRVTFTANAGYEFSNNTTFTINGENTGCYGTVNQREYILYNIAAPTYAINCVAFNLSGDEDAGTVYLTTDDEQHGTYVYDSVSENTQVAINAVANQGYEFVGWRKGAAQQPSATFTEDASTTYTVTENVWLYAAFQKIQQQPTTYTVTFEANGGAGSMNNEDGISGNYTLPACGFTAPNGQQFKAWAIGSVNGEQKLPDDQITVTGDTVIYAIWEDTPPAASANLDISPDSITFVAAEVGYAAPAAETVTVTNSGDAASGPLTISITGSGADAFTLSKNSIPNGLPAKNGADTFTVQPETGLSAGTYEATITVSDGNQLSVSATVSFTVTASQQPTTYTVTVNNGSGGGSYAEGASVTITADAPQSGYVFDKWTITGVTVDENQSTVTFTMPANNVTATATYKTDPQQQPTYGISVSPASVDFGSVEAGYSGITPVTITVTNTGSSHTGSVEVSLDDVGRWKYSLFDNGTGDATNVIYWNGLGINAGSSLSFTVQPLNNMAANTHNATITISGTNIAAVDIPVTFTVTPAQTPQPTQHNVAITGSYAQNSGAGNYAVGDIVNIDAGSRSGYEFIGWVVNSGNVTLADDDATATSFTMGDEDVSLTAKWLKKSSSAGGSNYKIVVEEAEDGSVAANRKSAPKGATVIITVEPDKGFELDEVTVVDKRGREVELKDKGDGRFSFKMPARDVTVSAKFSEKEQVNPFTDISEEDAYYDAVLWAVENGVTSGFSATTFAPYGPCTRAQMMTFLWRSIGRPAPSSTEHPFTDIKDDYYFEAVLWAVEEGITVGTTPTTFGPDEPCTRAQMATFLFRLVGDEAEEPAGRYADVLLHKYYALPVEWAAENGYIDGISEELFAPEDVCTRATMVTALYRLANK